MVQTILIAEDDAFQRETLQRMLERGLGYAVMATANGAETMEALRASRVGDIAAVILDLQMPVMDGFATLGHIRRERPDLPVLVLTASDNTDDAVRAIKAGALDFIAKPPELANLQVSLANAIRMAAMSHELVRLRRDKEGALGFADLIGARGGLSDSVALGQRAAMSDVPVLISGETGVGKELFARAIHGESRRVGGAFVALNCGAIPQNLVESTLFGHEKGAFTGAVARSLGKFREADGGTIFLDEIGELPLAAQVALLRVLQQQEVEPVGAGKPVKVNVRIVSATNRDLKQEVAVGRFREDLFFRLNVLPILVPPLRARATDIGLLAEYFIARQCAANGWEPKRLPVEARKYLEQCRWQGNVRELENVLYRALVLCEGPQLEVALLQQVHGEDFSALAAESVREAKLQLALRDNAGYFKPLAVLEREAMEAALRHFDQNITRAADALGMAKSTFYRKMKAFGH